MSGTCSTRGREESYRHVFGGKFEVKRPLGRPRCRWEGDSNMDIQKIGWRVWTGIFCMNIGTSGRLCENLNDTSGFSNTKGMSRLVEKLFASEEGLCSVYFVQVELPVWPITLLADLHWRCIKAPKFSFVKQSCYYYANF